MGIRGLLPEGYFEEGSEMRRILLKQHPWLRNIDPSTTSTYEFSTMRST